MAIMRVFRSALGIRLIHPDGKDPQVLAKEKGERNGRHSLVSRHAYSSRLSFRPVSTCFTQGHMSSSRSRVLEPNVVEVCHPTSIRRAVIQSWVA
jgi:hypothetical protein